jgi:hypothetical protein
MPAALGPLLVSHVVHHVDELGLKSYRNGALLSFARSEFDVLVTLDKGILYQHNHEGQSLRIIVVRVQDSRKTTIIDRAPDLLKCLGQIKLGEHREI